MSQSDYIKYKKTQTMLKDQTKLNKVLNETQYSDFESYQIENNVANTKNRYSKLVPPNSIVVMNMEKKITSCPSFLLCRNTQNRPNRILNTYVSQEATPTLKIDMQNHKKIGENGKEPIENSVKCSFVVRPGITRNYTCYKLPKLCKCKTSINPQT